MKHVRKRLFTAILVIVLFMSAGTVFFHYSEGWSYFDSFYFSGVTLTTVGYGDLTPHAPASKIFALIMAFSGIGLVFYSVGILSQHYFRQEVERNVHRVVRDAERFIKKEERQAGAAIHKTVSAVKKEEKQVERFFKKFKPVVKKPKR